MPKAFPAEFRRDVIAVARKGEASIAQGARDFGISESCLARRLMMADPEELRLAFITWIEKTYDRRRLGRLNPSTRRSPSPQQRPNPYRNESTGVAEFSSVAFIDWPGLPNP